MPIETITAQHLPTDPRIDCVYCLTPVDPDPAYYQERTDRNIGWITREEQSLLARSVVGIAGCGGMGGLLASIFVRLGIGEVRIADCEAFDISNINRQYGAKRSTVGQSKAFVTARETRAVSDDTTLVVYPQGIDEESVERFLDGCDIVCDEIEFWAIGARILLHERARARGITVFNANTVGFGTNLFAFRPEGYTMEDCLGFTYSEARALQHKVQMHEASAEEIALVMERVLKGLVPQLAEYSLDQGYSTADEVRQRLLGEGRASIVSTNPPLASGFLADHVLLELVRGQGLQRNTIVPPQLPQYLHFDAGRFLAEVRTIIKED